jgi:hypothetical protein
MFMVTQFSFARPDVSTPGGKGRQARTPQFETSALLIESSYILRLYTQTSIPEELGRCMIHQEAGEASTGWSQGRSTTAASRSRVSFIVSRLRVMRSFTPVTNGDICMLSQLRWSSQRSITRLPPSVGVNS